MKLRIEEQGSPIINIDRLTILYESERVIIGEIDMHSKNCEIDCIFYYHDGQFGFGIRETKYSLYLDQKRAGIPTKVLIEGLDGRKWSVFLIACSRYTIKFVLFKEK